MDPGNNNRPRDIKPKVAVGKKKAKGAAAPAPAPAPAGAAAIGNAIWDEESDFDVLEKYVQQGSFKRIEEFMKSHKKFDVLAKDPKKGYSIWDVVLFKGDAKIKAIIRTYRSTAIQLDAFRRTEELFDIIGKPATVQNVPVVRNAHIHEEKRKKEEADAAAAAEKKRKDELYELQRLKWAEEARKAREEAEFMAKNFNAAVQKIEELIRANVEDPADPRFQELLEMLKNGVDLKKAILNPFLPPIPDYNRLHPTDPRLVQQKITLLELLTFFEDPLLVQVFDTLRAPVQNTNVRPEIRRQNKLILDEIAEEAQKIRMGSQADKYRLGMKNTLARYDYFRSLYHFGIYYMGAETRESYEARQPKFMGRTTSVMNAKNFFGKAENEPYSKFNQLYNSDKEKLQKIIDKFKQKPEIHSEMLPLLNTVLPTNSNWGGMNGLTSEGYKKIEKLKYLLQNKLILINENVANTLRSFIGGESMMGNFTAELDEFLASIPFTDEELEVYIKNILSEIKKNDIDMYHSPLPHILYEFLLRYKSVRTPEETLALLKTIPREKLEYSDELITLYMMLNQEISEKQPYTGYTQPQLVALNEMLYRPADVSFCPVCLLGITRPTGCLYMEHDCRDTGFYHKELYDKYKDYRGKIGWCTVCGRICQSHVHYKLATAAAPKPDTSPPVAGAANFFDSDCIRQGGGGLLEKFVRLRAFRTKALELQPQVGVKSDYAVRKELVEAVWDSFVDKSGNAQAQALLNRVKVDGKQVFNAIQRRLPLGATPATHNFIPTDEERLRLNSLFTNVGMVPTSAFPTGNEASSANRIAAIEQAKANAKLQANAVAKSFPWPNAANATKQPVGAPGFCDVGLHDADPVWEFQHGVSMDTHGRICDTDLTTAIQDRVKTSYRDENAIKCWAFPGCKHTLWPEEIRGKVSDDVYEAYRVFFNKHILATKGGIAPVRGGSRPLFHIKNIPFIQTNSASLGCSLPNATASSRLSMKTRKRRNGGGKTRRRRKSRYY